jgi:hypothetical protein
MARTIQRGDPTRSGRDKNQTHRHPFCIPAKGRLYKVDLQRRNSSKQRRAQSDRRKDIALYSIKLSVPLEYVSLDTCLSFRLQPRLLNPDIIFQNHSLNTWTGYGSIRCAIAKSEFRKDWDKWGIVVSE